MRKLSALVILTLGLTLGVTARSASGQTCTGLCLQQVTCAGNATTSITGTVYAPNGTDPLPNVTVYIPNAPVDPFTPGVSCPVVGAPPSGSPLVGTTTDVNGNFTLVDVPVSSNIPLVIVSGRWRRQFVIPSTTACVNNPLPAGFTVMPQNQTQGDIPKIAIATGSVDPVECVLMKMGISQSEFTDSSGPGRINIFGGGGAAGSGLTIDSGTPTQASLMGNQSTLNSYDLLMLPCEGGDYVKPAQELANLVNFANAGGRVYSSHYSYSWMWQNPPFNGVANWAGRTVSDPQNGDAAVNTSFAAGQTLSTWLQEVGASTSPGQMALNTLREDQTGVNSPTQTWLTLDNPSVAMQFVWDTPIAPVGQVINQCGRVLFNEYHVETSSFSSFANELNSCSPSTGMTPQEKLLEYMLFELTSEGGEPTLNPTTQDFGSEAIGFASPPQTFTWTNNSSFTYQISGAQATGDFTVVSNNCGSVAGGASCQIVVTFTPTALGARTGTLTVSSSSNQLTAQLTGTGTPGYTLSGTSLSYGNQDVGFSATQTLTLTSVASGPLPIPPFVTNGPFSVSTAACGNTIAAGASCPIAITFLPTTTGPLNGTLGVNSTSLLYNGLSASFTGNGVDFTLVLNPAAGSVVAGDAVSTTATLTPIAGFATPLSIGCNVTAAATAAVCSFGTATGTGAGLTVPPATLTASISTTSQYTVVGYGGFGGTGVLWLAGMLSGWLLWRTRRRAGRMLRCGLMLAVLAAIGLSMTACSGKLPAQNPAFTSPGSYAVTVTATDGFLIHSATYNLSVSSK